MEQFDLWDAESKQHNRELELQEIERYYQELRLELDTEQVFSFAQYLLYEPIVKTFVPSPNTTC